MKKSDERKVLEAKDGFYAALKDYFDLLKVLSKRGIEPTVDQYHALTINICKMTKTLRRINDTNNEEADYDI